MSEKQTLRTIQAVYKKALQDIENKLVISNGKIETLLKDIDSLTDEQQSILQSQIYQRKMQRSLKSQLEIMLKDLAVNQYRTVNDYLKNSYQNGYIGALYNINMQGMPLILPVDPYLVHRAIEIDSKIKHGLYRNLVDKVDVFKRRIANDISRGIASSASYHDMATWIRHDTKVSVGKSMRIVRTEGNRVYNAATLDCGKGAKERGCDLVKVWDSTLDMKTRPTHRECDGQIRELNEDFKNANGEAKAPGQFGIASEDINCRCAVLIKPRWDVDSRFTKRDNQSGELKEFEGVKSYKEFKKKYWKTEKNTVEKLEKQMPEIKFTKANSIEEAESYAKKFISDGFSPTFKNQAVYKGISLEHANELNKTLEELYTSYDMSKISGIKVISPTSAQGKKAFKDGSDAVMSYNPVEKGIFINKNILKDAKTLEKYNKEAKEAYDLVIGSIDKLSGSQKQLALTYKNAGRSVVGDGSVKDYITHEMGHHVQWQELTTELNNSMGKKMSEYAPKISGYANASKGEYIAESFSAYTKGEKNLLDPEFVKFMEKKRI